MPLQVRTNTGKEFWRCGMCFGPNPTVLDDAEINKPFQTGVNKDPKKLQTVRQHLEDTPALICIEISAKEAAKLAGKADDPEAGDGKAGNK